MHIHVKYQIFPFHSEIIRNIALQNNGNLLAFSGGIDSSTLEILPYEICPNYSDSDVKEKIIFTPPNKNSIFKKSISLLKFSPNDEYLATACETLIIYHSITKEMPPSFVEYKNYKDHSLEITALAWSPDSQKIASSSLGHRIVVRDITKTDDSVEKIINLDIKVLGLIWDPLDKYLIGLCGDSRVRIWWTKGWETFKNVNLSFSPGKPQFNSKREDRKIDFSPDFKYFLIPSLDDKIVPVVCALDRQDFDVKFTYMGPFSSINCIRFSPVLYEKSDAVISVFAMGDNDGNISIWCLGDKLLMDKPFFLFKAHSNGTELIEDLAWNSKGNLLMATTLKRYVSCILFDQENFGRPLKEDEINDYRRGLFGAKTLDINHSKLKIFKGVKESKFSNFMGLNESNFNGNNEANELKNQNVQPVKTILTEQKVVIQNGKKKIIPQMQKIVEEKPININDNDVKENSDILMKKDLLEETAENNQKNEKSGKLEVKEKAGENFIEIEDDLVISKIIEENIDLKSEKEKNSEDLAQKNQNVQPIVKKKKTLAKNEALDKVASDKNLEKISDNNKKISKNPITITDKNDKSKISPLKKLNKPKTVDAKSLIISEKPKEKTPRKSFVEQLPSFSLKIPLVQIPELLIVQMSFDRSLEFEKKNHQITKIRCILQRNNFKEVLWTDILDGELQIFEINANFLCFYTSKSLLFILDAESGRRAELPLFVAELIFLRINEKNDLLLLKSTGELKVFNLQTKKDILSENISFLIKEHASHYPEYKDNLIEFLLLDKNAIPYLSLKPRQLYFFNLTMKMWQRLEIEEFELGLVENGDFGLKATVIQNKQRSLEKLDNFFEKLTGENISNEEKGSVSKLEEKLMFFEMGRDWKNYEENLKRYIVKLIEKREVHKLRQIIVDLFINEQRKEYKFLRENLKEPRKIYQEIMLLVLNAKGMEDVSNEIQQFIELSGCFH